ncbi:MAG TPA: sensor domain-containing diguanylate cyclase [Bacilli bacterium]|nr:sensor domain-containing diguanylate cyclase [Bacilli bacterium]
MTIYISLLFGHLILLAFSLNFCRFRLSTQLNKILILLMVIYSYGLAILFVQEWLLLFSLLAIFTATALYQTIGLLVALPLISFVYFYMNGFELYHFVIFTLSALIVAYLTNQGAAYVRTQNRWKSLLIKNSKQLNVIREISIAMQQTRDLDKVLHIIITSVTAGHGLGFNRALVFLFDKNKNQLSGMMGIGPLNAQEGLKKWRAIAEHKFRLIDLLEIDDEKQIDPQLNQIINHLTIDLDSDHILKDVLLSGKHRVIYPDKVHDHIHQLLINKFNIDEFLIIPMIYQSTKIGLLILDNPVSKKSITEQEIDNVIPLASLAAVAIQQAQLYQEIEEMTLKDGLTSLYNQRALQNTLQKHFNKNQIEPLAMIMLDIDYFKTYNDTNGHLLGNEVLELLAKVIKDSIRESDLAFRFGGEEFTVLLFNTTNHDVNLIAERIRESIESTVFPNESSQPGNRLTVTLGYAHTEQISNPSPSRLISAADQALYEGKAAGKNCVNQYRISLQSK